MTIRTAVLSSLALLAVPSLHAQNMSGMNMSGMDMSAPNTLALTHNGSGTDFEPPSYTPPMLMQMRGNWMLMEHGQAQIVDQQQSSPRGGDKFYSNNWAMFMAQRSAPHGQLTLRGMFSLEPATISGRYFPEMFQQGETAFGKPIVDGQHPHNLFMELAAFYDLSLGSHTTFTLYGGPVGDPALGPEAYPHRASAAEDPLAPLTHHLQDSTHIAWDVITAGVTFAPAKSSTIRLEASGFHGREPDENRWHIEVGAIDSWSARIAATFAHDWQAQYSLGHLTSPEVVSPNEDTLRQTASVQYHHAWSGLTLDSTAAWGRNHTIGKRENDNGYLFEALAKFGNGKHFLWTREENADRTSQLLGASAPAEESSIGRVAAFSAGYAHSLYHTSWATSELGAQATMYNTPATLVPLYDAHPYGVAMTLNVHLGSTH